jgi:Zn-dependent protease
MEAGPLSTARISGAVRPSPVFLGIVALAAAGGALAWRNDTTSNTARAGVFVLVVAGWIVSLCLHEFAHAYTAWRAGDREVEVRGYLTLNPLRYSHPVLSIALPIFFIALGGFGLPGGAVYVRPGLFGPTMQRRISLAGPAVNVVLAIALLAAIRILADGTHAAFWFGLSFLAFLQITAAVLNLLPIPGLDGYGALEPSLSPKTRRALDQYKPLGLLAVLALLWVPSINAAFFDAVYWLFELSGVPADWSRFGSYLTQFWR